MKRRRHTPEQIVRKLAEEDKLLAEGKSIEEVARHLEITESTYHRWRNQFGGMVGELLDRPAPTVGEFRDRQQLPVGGDHGGRRAVTFHDELVYRQRSS